MNRIEALKIARAALARKIPPLEKRFWSKVDKRGPDECWPWLAGVRRKDEGYGAFSINGKHRPAHQVAWELTHGKIPDGIQCLHKCDNPPCVNPAHLFLGTPLDNNNDKVRKKRHVYGERVGTAKLTESEAKQIKNMKPNGRCPRGIRIKLANKFNVSPATISDVWNRRWLHL